VSEQPGATHEASDADIAPIIEKLKALHPEQVKGALDQQYSVDPRVGIVITGLPDIEAVVTGGQTFRFHGARIMPASSGIPNYVKPHVHEKGQEPYVIISGNKGVMNTGQVAGERVDWNEPGRQVAPGDVIVVEEGQVHSLINNSGEPLDFAFACPDSHLEDRSLDNPQGDSMFTTHLDNPLPPHYPPAD
jgi:mannose-6-phosphate isomerase-like protein (cupin superfamily)